MHLDQKVLTIVVDDLDVGEIAFQIVPSSARAIIIHPLAHYCTIFPCNLGTWKSLTINAETMDLGFLPETSKTTVFS